LIKIKIVLQRSTDLFLKENLAILLNFSRW
jgi:hypothetical protein